MNKDRFSLNMVPKMLSLDQKEKKVDMYWDFIDLVIKTKVFVKETVTGEKIR